MSAAPGELPLFPLSTVLFPGGRLSLKVFETRYVDMTKACLRDDTPFGVCLIREGREVGAPATPHPVGCSARIAQWDMPHPNLFTLLTQGESRFRVLESWVAANGLVHARVEWLPAPTAPATVDRACQEVLRLALERAGAASVPGPVRLDDPVWVSYRLAEILPIAADQQQALLEDADTAQRLARIRDLLVSHGVIEKLNKNN